MSTNGNTRGLILESASELASLVGLTCLSIGGLAEHLDLPKSTVSSHFQSKEDLQLAVLRNAARELHRDVIRPASLEPDGLPRLEGLVNGWMKWDGRGCYPGGCLFVTAAFEFDGQPGPVRDQLVRRFHYWRHLLGRRVERAVTSGTFRPDTDRVQFLHDLTGIMLSYHQATRLLLDPAAERLARRAFAMLVDRARLAA